ncbi:glycoside hydrolase family 2 TIM barrel-domain containing protein [uncultured Sunxiuqinia sp.]|uniref:glycoside hydrolase family 2 TIM barrel-domain containing protein n=1 Tax=uncultured Sunxiuqinia sp. TaxID=1573825 RepID=UPI002AA7A59A|nr:glycoside hydrolase family 2 TIM barrel-domain containing protein [uncultured Sunxiuqinia sp.]
MMKLLTLNLLVLFTSFLFAQETETIYLSGTGAEDAVEWEFYCSDGRKSGEWSTIAVPSCWEQQGFGDYNYGHDPFEERLNETGLYRYNFTVPKSWKNKEITIVFDGVMTDAEVKINDKLAGPVHQGAFYQFRYDISKLVKAGNENQLEVLVKKHSENLSVNQAERKADFWIFGGIFRPVFLEVKPKTNIQRVAINAKHSGDFTADVHLKNSKTASTIHVDIQTLDGEVQTSFKQPITANTNRVQGNLRNPLKWNPEYPNLYNAVFSLLDKSGKTIHQYTERFGFRTIEVRESDGIYVNGVHIKMKGVDRHTFHPKYGRTSSKELSITAVNLMKDMNMNAVRMSHYPPDKHFLDVCDSLGLFVLDELTAWQKPSYDDAVGRELLEEMIAHDVNHPSIIIWANGNEGGENNSLNDDFAKLDIQKRIVIHPWQDYEMTNTLHYFDYNYLSNDGFSKRKILFPTEIIHGLYDGGHGAGLDDFWLRMWSDPLCAGAFLWVFADEAIERTDRNNEFDTDGNHAPDGIVGPYNEKEGSFFTIKEIWSPIFFEKRYITPDFNGKFNIENRFLYTNLDQCAIKAGWLKFSSPSEKGKETISKPEHINIHLKPGQNGQLQVSLPDNWRQFDALSITATDQYGKNINTWSWPVKKAAIKARELLVKNSGLKPELEETQSELKVKAGQLEISIKKNNGTIAELKNNGLTIPLSNGPVFMSKEKQVKHVKHYFNGNELIITATFENDDHFKWTINGNGQVDLAVAYQPANNCQFAGISFDFPEKNVAGMKWLGDGPYRVYKNRMKGVNFGLWEKEYNNTITGESGFIYPEFKGYHANTYWAEIKGKNAPGFTVYVETNDIFLRMLTPDAPAAPARTKIDYPAGDISFLHGINAIGSKFKNATSFGPQSSPYRFNPTKIHGGKLFMKLTFDFS